MFVKTREGAYGKAPPYTHSDVRPRCGGMGHARSGSLGRGAAADTGCSPQLIPNVSYTASSRSLYTPKIWGGAESPT